MTSNGKGRRSRWEWARWLLVAIILVGGFTYLLAFYVPDALTRHNANPAVVSAWISGGATFLGVVATAAVAIFAFWYARSTNQATIDAANANLKDQGKQLDQTLTAQREQLGETLTAQREQLDKTLTAQREQLDSTLAEQRTRTLNERFATAASQLGSDKPPAVRLAGVYAMAGLADDWKENRQTCVDVLCGYLRMPYEPDPGVAAPEPKQLAFRADREVRHTVIRVITAHLHANAALSWQELNFDFTGVVFDGGDFSSAVFSGGEASFDEAKFTGGETSFHEAKFTGGEVSFKGAQFSSGKVSFRGAQFSSGEVSFKGARFSDGEVGFTLAKFSGGRVDFGDATFLGGDGKVDLSYTSFSGGEVSFDGARFSGKLVDFNHATFSGSNVSFTTASFAGSRVDFGYTRFSGGRVDLSAAFFWRGDVDFTDATDWSHPPDFGPEGPDAEVVKMPAENRPTPPNNSK